MIVGDLVGWWYGRGWAWATNYFLIEKSKRILDFFSFFSLLKTLLAPYRQSYAGSTRGSLGAKFRSLIDRSISRVIGFVVRLIILFIASLLLILNLVISLAIILLWPLVPVAPLLGIVFLIFGVTNEL